MNWQEFGTGLASIAAAFVTLAIVSVVVSRKSQAPALVQATGTTFSRIIAAAVDPAHAANNGNNGQNTFTTPISPLSPSYFSSLILGQG